MDKLRFLVEVSVSNCEKLIDWIKTWKDVVDSISTMRQFNIIKIYIIFKQQQDTNCIQVPIDYKPGNSGTHPGT